MIRPDLPWVIAVFVCCCCCLVAAPADVRGASAEVRFDKDYLAGLVEKLPPLPFDKADQAHGSVHGYRLLAIDPRTRRFRVACLVDGEFRPSIANPLPQRAGRGGPDEPLASGPWRRFKFEVQVGINIEPG